MGLNADDPRTWWAIPRTADADSNRCWPAAVRRSARSGREEATRGVVPQRRSARIDFNVVGSAKTPVVRLTDLLWQSEIQPQRHVILSLPIGDNQIDCGKCSRDAVQR